MSAFASENWEDMNEPLRHILHPETHNLLKISVAGLMLIATIFFVIPPSFITGGLVGLLTVWFTIWGFNRNNVTLNPVSSGKKKTWINVLLTVTLTWSAFYLIACISTEIVHLLNVIT